MKKITEIIDNEDYDILILDNAEFSEIDGDSDKVRRVYGEKSIAVKLEENGQLSSIPSSGLSEEEKSKLEDLVDEKLNRNNR